MNNTLGNHTRERKNLLTSVGIEPTTSGIDSGGRGFDSGNSILGLKPGKKNQGFNGIRTRDLRDTGAILYQLSYEATRWQRGQFIEFISSRAVNSIN